MFRFLLRRPRTVRVPIEQSNVGIQQVKVTRQSRPVVARFILTCIITTAVIQGVKYWDPLGTYARRDVLSEELERVKKDTQREHGDKYGKHWDKQHAEMKGSKSVSSTADITKSDALRITVPIWLRQGHQRIYRPDDVEWKEFIKLQGDAQRIDQIKRLIGESVMHQVKDHGRNKFEMTVIKFNGRVAVALEVVPQLFTPPLYEVPCIWLSTTSISAGWRPLPPQTGARIERVFRPVVLLEASTAAIKTFSYMTYVVTKARIMEALGKQKPGHKSTLIVPQIPPQSKNGSANTSSEETKSAKPIFPMFPDFGNGDAMRKMHADVVSSMPYSTAIQHAAFAFNQVKNIRQRLAISTNVRGICQVRGYITFFGDRGKFRLEVIAYYLPAENAFVGAVNVKGGYIVQDYQAWDKIIADNQKKLRKLPASAEGKPAASEKPKPEEPPSPPASDQNKERDK